MHEQRFPFPLCFLLQAKRRAHAEAPMCSPVRFHLMDHSRQSADMVCFCRHLIPVRPPRGQRAAGAQSRVHAILMVAHLSIQIDPVAYAVIPQLLQFFGFEIGHRLPEEPQCLLLCQRIDLRQLPQNPLFETQAFFQHLRRSPVFQLAFNQTVCRLQIAVINDAPDVFRQGAAQFVQVPVHFRLSFLKSPPRI